MNITAKYFLKYFLPALLLLVIVFMPCYNRAHAFECTGDIFKTLTQIRDSGKGGANPEQDAWAIFKLAGCALTQLTTYILSLANIIAIIMIIISGLRYMGSAGNPTAQQGAVKSLNASVIGFAILICFWSFFLFLLKILRV